MKRLLILVVCLLMSCGCFSHKENIHSIEIPLPTMTVSLDKNIDHWYYYTDKEKFELIMKTVELGNGAARFRITGNPDSVSSQVANQLMDLELCVSNTGWEYFLQFNHDVEIGSVIINCLSRNGHLSD